MGFNLSDYEPVEDRLARFWEQHPDGRVLTQLLSKPTPDEWVVFAEVYRTADDTRPYATGLAHEVVTGRGVNSTSALENCETSAIGRALANAGYAPKGARPSREEMQKADRAGPVGRGAPTEKQLAFAKRLAEDLGSAAATVVPSIVEEITGRKAKLVDLDKTELSAVIDELKPLSDEAKKAYKADSKAHDAKLAEAERLAATGEEPFDE
jgi:hypothetical protein